MYGIMHIPSGKMLGVDFRTNTGEFCTDVEFSFNATYPSVPVWNVETEAEAEKARTSHPEWYNAGWETPKNDYDSDDLVVVRIDINA